MKMVVSYIAPKRVLQLLQAWNHGISRTLFRCSIQPLFFFIVLRGFSLTKALLFYVELRPDSKNHLHGETVLQTDGERAVNGSTQHQKG